MRIPIGTTGNNTVGLSELPPKVSGFLADRLPVKNVVCLLRSILGAVALGLLAGCASTQTASRPLFHEEAKADVIVQFPGWESISITKPDTGENGFLPFYRRDDAERRLAQLMTRRNLAVVVCNFTYTADQQAEQQKAWTSIFSKLGYHRVVFLHAGRTRGVNGLIVVKDVRLDDATRVGG